MGLKGKVFFSLLIFSLTIKGFIWGNFYDHCFSKWNLGSFFHSIVEAGQPTIFLFFVYGCVFRLCSAFSVLTKNGYDSLFLSQLEVFLIRVLRLNSDWKHVSFGIRVCNNLKRVIHVNYFEYEWILS